MSTFEDSYPPLLQGVSQQTPQTRHAGQVTAQDNMLSDVVTHLRRRPGAQFLKDITMPGANADRIAAWDTEIGGQRVQVVLETTTGVVRVLDRNFTALYTSAPTAYLVAADVNAIQVATAGDELFLGNIGVKPALGPPIGIGSTANCGYLHINVLALDSWYIVALSTNLGSASSHGRPAATGDTPTMIAADIAASVNLGTGTHGITATASGAGVFFRHPTATWLSVTSVGPVQDGNISAASASAILMGVSGRSYVRSSAELPDTLPALAADYLMATGDPERPVYYRYSTSTAQWLESGDVSSPLTITGTPISVTRTTAGVWSLDTSPFDGRFAGDEFTNPGPNFTKVGITGVGSYHGRLVLLAGPLICMSAAGAPRQFYRATVAQLLDGDPIAVGASAASSAAWRYAVQFESDLVLFSEKYQGVIVGTAQAITPRTASVAVTSLHSADMTTRPVTVGRTLMYPMQRSRDFFGMLEMSQSQTEEGKRTYISDDITGHIPRYMAGRCRLAAASSSASMALFQPTGDMRSLVVYEYIWEGAGRVQAAWHKWTFAYPLAMCYFVGQELRLGFYQNGRLVILNMDPRGSSYSLDGELMPKVDFGAFVDVVNRAVAIPDWMLMFDPAIRTKLRAADAAGDLAGEQVGLTVVGSAVIAAPSYPNGRLGIGIPYTSTVSPTPPMRKDDTGVKISSNKMTVLRYMVGTANTKEYEVSVTDDQAGSGETLEATMTFSTVDLVLGKALDSDSAVMPIPARTDADSTSFIISTSGVGELNLVSLEFIARYNEKIRRIRKK